MLAVTLAFALSVRKAIRVHGATEIHARSKYHHEPRFPCYKEADLLKCQVSSLDNTAGESLFFPTMVEDGFHFMIPNKTFSIFPF